MNIVYEVSINLFWSSWGRVGVGNKIISKSIHAMVIELVFRVKNLYILLANMCQLRRHAEITSNM